MSTTLLVAIVRTHARRFESGRSVGYAFSADRNVSWKQSSASAGPAEAIRNRYTITRWSSMKSSKGGSPLRRIALFNDAGR